LSNGRGETNEYNKFVIEDVNDDLSSMWMTSTQRVRLSTSQRNIGSGVDNQSEFDEPTIILNSNRLVLNSKSERIILSAAETVNVATPNWAMDLDSLFTEIKNLVDGVIDLNENLEKAHEQISKAHQQIASLSTELASLKVTTAAGPGVVSPDQIPKFLASKGISEVNKRNTDSNKVDSTSIKQTIQSILQTISRMEQ
jgi:regulator of replication initiation timing